MTLADETAAFSAKSAGMFSDEQKAIYKRSQEHIEASDILATALKVGDTAPNFQLPDAYGKMVSLSDVLATGPAVVSFYRGAWCPFCNLELRAMQRELVTAESSGVTLIAISPNTPDESLGMIDKDDLTFPVLSDAGNAVAKQFNLVYEMESGIVDLYREQGRDIGAMNDSDAWELPVPATYVIDQAGVIQYAFVDLNHRVRAEPSEVVAVAARL